MGQLHIKRPHNLGWDGARELAHTWVAESEDRWRLACETIPKRDHECITFRGAGVQGELLVWPDRFELQLQLGFLLSAYQSRIEAEIQRQLDLQLGRAQG
jgi:putative polyhydroxyalkanoate system protein